MSLRKGIFPNVLKYAIVKALHKGSPKDELGNFRQISLLTTISKVFESCVKQKLVTWLEHRNYFNCYQHGFRAHKRIETAIYKVFRRLFFARWTCTDFTLLHRLSMFST
jgi:hypothetical protein